MSELDGCIAAGDSTNKGAINLAEFVQMLSVNGIDNSLGIFATVDSDVLQNKIRDFRKDMHEQSLSFEICKLPIGLQLQMKSVGCLIPVDKFKAMCALSPKQRTDSELTELGDWLMQSTHMSLLDDMSTHQMHELCRHCKLAKFQPGQEIFNVDDEINEVYLILDGHATLNRVQPPEDMSEVYLPWAWLRHEGRQAHACVQTLVELSDVLRPYYARNGQIVPALIAMGSACSTTSKNIGRWTNSLSNSFPDDCDSVLGGLGLSQSEQSIATAVEWIEQAIPAIETVSRPLQLMWACEMIVNKEEACKQRRTWGNVLHTLDHENIQVFLLRWLHQLLSHT